jgi:endonuclease/exonuclease/phosphatase family metal-dependent hydrolase
VRSAEHARDMIVAVALTTWNVGGAPSGVGVPDDARLLLRNLADTASVIVVGLQEVPRPSRGWKAALLSALPPRWVVCCGSRYAGMRVVVLMQEGMRPLVTPMRTMRAGTGVGDRWPNKGAVAVVVRVVRTTVCFVVAHLAAQEGNLKSREEDYANIVRRLQNEDSVHGSASVPLFSQYDHVFVMGDLNYRLNPRPAVGSSLEARVRWVEGRVAAKDWTSLAEVDELAAERDRALVFVNFHEGPLRFPPTFKYEPRSERGSGYNGARIPSYCDRILWHSLPARRPMISQTTYTSVEDVRSSDHIPVLATFELHVPSNSPRPTVLEGGGRRVVLEFLIVRFRREKYRERSDGSNGAPGVAERRRATAGGRSVSQVDPRSAGDGGGGGGGGGGSDAINDDDFNDDRSSSSTSSSASSGASSSVDSLDGGMSDSSSYSSSSSSSDGEDESAAPPVGNDRQRGRPRMPSFISRGAKRRSSSCGRVDGLASEAATAALLGGGGEDRGQDGDASSSSSDDEAFAVREGGRHRLSQGRRKLHPPLPRRLGRDGGDAPESGGRSLDRGTVGMLADEARRRDGRAGLGGGEARGLAIPRAPSRVGAFFVHTRSSSGPGALQVCHSGNGGLTADGADEPVRRDSLTQSLSRVNSPAEGGSAGSAAGGGKRNARRHKKRRLSHGWMMDVHGTAVFLKPRRVYRAELKKCKDGSRYCAGDALPAIPLHPVSSIQDLRLEHCQISFWRAKSRIGTCGVLPLGDIVQNAAAGGAVHALSFELPLTKYGARAGTLEASVRLVVSDSRLWMDGARRVVRTADGGRAKRYRGPLGTRSNGSARALSLSSQAARTAQSARAAKAVVAHRLDSLGSEGV